MFTGSVEDHTGRRFAAIAWWQIVVRAVVNRVQYRALCGKVIPHAAVQRLEAGLGDHSLRDATLIGDHDYGKTRVVQKMNTFGDLREKFKTVPDGNVLPFRGFAIDDAVTIQKRGLAHERVPVPRFLR